MDIATCESIDMHFIIRRTAGEVAAAHVKAHITCPITAGFCHGEAAIGTGERHFAASGNAAAQKKRVLRGTAIVNVGGDGLTIGGFYGINNGHRIQKSVSSAASINDRTGALDAGHLYVVIVRAALHGATAEGGDGDVIIARSSIQGAAGHVGNVYIVTNTRAGKVAASGNFCKIKVLKA